MSGGMRGYEQNRGFEGGDEASWEEKWVARTNIDTPEALSLLDLASDVGEIDETGISESNLS